jgi:methyl coenzyme M reductase alpha subunit
VLNTRRSIAKRFRKLGEAIMADYDFTRCKAKLNPAKSISKMLRLRSTLGADTPAGHRISNIDEIRQNKAKAVGDPVRLAYLDASMARQLADLESTRSALSRGKR